HFARPAISDRQPGRARSQTRCSLRFPDSNPRDAAFRRRYRKSWGDWRHQKACDSRGIRVRSSVSVPLAEVKRVASDLDEVSALQRAHARGLPGDEDRSIRAQEGLRAAHLNAPMLGKDGVVLEQIDVTLLAAADGGKGLVEDELLSRKRAGGHVKPAVL